MTIYGAFFLLFVFAIGAAGQSGCPSVSILGPETSIVVNEPATFKVVLSGEVDSSKLKFTWAASGGGISRPFAGPTMELTASKEYQGTNIYVGVRVTGLPAVCRDTAWEVAGVASVVQGDPADRFSAIPFNDIRARVDNIFLQLSNEPNYRAILEMRFATTETPSQRLRRVNRILSAIRLRKYDLNRVTFAVYQDCPWRYAETVVWFDVIGGRGIESPKATLISGAELAKNPKKALPKRQCLCE